MIPLFARRAFLSRRAFLDTSRELLFHRDMGLTAIAP